MDASISVKSPCAFPSSGAVFVNGKEMTNQLPAITVGSSVTFDMEVVNLFPVSNNNNPSDGGNFKLRVTIGSGNREVVFDWLLDQVVDSLFFGCSFTHPGWKVLVFWLLHDEISSLLEFKTSSSFNLIKLSKCLVFRCHNLPFFFPYYYYYYYISNRYHCRITLNFLCFEVRRQPLLFDLITGGQVLRSLHSSTYKRDCYMLEESNKVFACRC